MWVSVWVTQRETADTQMDSAYHPPIGLNLLHFRRSQPPQTHLTPSSCTRTKCGHKHTRVRLRAIFKTHTKPVFIDWLLYFVLITTIFQFGYFRVKKKPRKKSFYSCHKHTPTTAQLLTPTQSHTHTDIILKQLLGYSGIGLITALCAILQTHSDECSSGGADRYKSNYKIDIF